MNTDSHSPSDIHKILELKNIAVVGMSNTEGKPANFVPQYLIENGYNVIPVNPNTTEVLGRKSYPKVSDVPEQVDIVGIYNQESEIKAKENGIDVVYNRCMKVEHSVLID